MVLINCLLVRPELLQYLSDLVVVLEPVAVEQIEHGCRVERGPLVPIDERMVGDEKAKQVKRFLVNRLGYLPETLLADVLQREFDVPLGSGRRDSYPETRRRCPRGC